MNYSDIVNGSKGVYLEACVMYFVKTAGKGGSGNGLSLIAFLNNTLSEKSNFEENLFWMLPGKYNLL